MKRFQNKVAVVTGAAQGLGLAIAEQLAVQGAAVVLVDRNIDSCQFALSAIRLAGGEALAVGCDLETAAGAQSALAATLGAYSRVDVLVNNVGGAIRAKPFWEYSHEELEQEVSRSLWPSLWCCREFIPVMRQQGFGSIVNIGSAATRWMWRVPYSAAKGGVHAMTAALGRELADSGVRINCVAPGALEISDRVNQRNNASLTDQEKQWRQQAFDQSLDDTPLARLGQVGEVASAVCYFASDESSYITGQTLFVAGGAVG